MLTIKKTLGAAQAQQLLNATQTNPVKKGFGLNKKTVMIIGGVIVLGIAGYLIWKTVKKSGSNNDSGGDIDGGGGGESVIAEPLPVADVISAPVSEAAAATGVIVNDLPV